MLNNTVPCSTALADTVSSTSNCTAEGELRVDPEDKNTTYKLLQICLVGEWNYVCNAQFNYDLDGTVALHQLQCKSGGTLHYYTEKIVLVRWRKR